MNISHLVCFSHSKAKGHDWQGQCGEEECMIHWLINGWYTVHASTAMLSFLTSNTYSRMYVKYVVRLMIMWTNVEVRMTYCGFVSCVCLKGRDWEEECMIYWLINGWTRSSGRVLSCQQNLARVRLACRMYSIHTKNRSASQKVL